MTSLTVLTVQVLDSNQDFVCELGMKLRMDVRTLIILVGLTMTWYSEKVMISYRYLNTGFHAQLA